MVRFGLASYVEPLTFMSLFPAVVLATILCGWRQGAFVLVLSALSVWYFFIPPVWTFEIDNPKGLSSLLGFVSIGGFDILILTALAEALSRLQEAKRLQEVLSHELQHRVGNNLQIAVSMLRDARRGLQDRMALQKISRAEDKILTMAQLHRRFCEAAAYANGLEPVLHELLSELFRDLPVRVNVTISMRQNLSVDQMAMVVLLVNEAATSAVKRVSSSAPGGGSFEVSISDKANGQVQLVIRDEGLGLSSAGPRDPGGRSVGIGIMRAFANRLGGSFEVLGNQGTAITVEFSPL
jgi:two-component sensor histidine kinase